MSGKSHSQITFLAFWSATRSPSWGGGNSCTDCRLICLLPWACPSCPSASEQLHHDIVGLTTPTALIWKSGNAGISWKLNKFSECSVSWRDQSISATVASEALCIPPLYSAPLLGKSDALKDPRAKLPRNNTRKKARKKGILSLIGFSIGFHPLFLRVLLSQSQKMSSVSRHPCLHWL